MRGPRGHRSAAAAAACRGACAPHRSAAGGQVHERWGAQVRAQRRVRCAQRWRGAGAEGGLGTRGCASGGVAVRRAAGSAAASTQDKAAGRFTSSQACSQRDSCTLVHACGGGAGRGKQCARGAAHGRQNTGEARLRRGGAGRGCSVCNCGRCRVWRRWRCLKHGVGVVGVVGAVVEGSGEGDLISAACRWCGAAAG